MVELGKSNVPLDKDIIKTEPPKEFFKEIIEKGILIVEDAVATSVFVKIYQVPVGKIFFLVSASLGFAGDGITSNDAQIRVSDNLKKILAVEVNDAIAQANVAVSFPIPLKFLEGIKLELRGSGALTLAIGTITGYELPRKIPGIV